MASEEVKKTSLFLASGEPAKGEKSEDDEEASLDDGGRGEGGGS